MRCFIAINFSGEFKEKIKKIQNQIPNFIKNKTKPENLHLTLKFLGEVDKNKIKIVKKELKKIKFQRFFSNLGKIGFFDNKNKGVIWIHLTNCEELQRQVDECLIDLFSRERRFMGHLTIARVTHLAENNQMTFENKRDFLKKLNEIKIPPLKFVVNEFYLMESFLKPEGSEYKIIKKYRLI
jgi:2'-5' RNA ligase